MSMAQSSIFNNGRIPSHFRAIASVLGRKVSIIPVLILVAAIAGAQPVHAGKYVQYPCTAQLTDGAGYAVQDDGKGPYSNGVDGTQCQVQASDGTSYSGDLLLTLNYSRSTTHRYANIDLSNPVAGTGSINRGIWSGAGLHLHRANLGDMYPGQTLVERIGFDIEYGGQDYKFRYGWGTADGTFMAIVTRTSATSWTITSDAPPQNAAKLWTGLSTGDPTVVTDLGNYYATFNLVITLK